MRRSTRLAALAVGVLGLVATTAPPAQAFTVGAAGFVANVTVQGGIGYPFLTLTTLGISVNQTTTTVNPTVGNLLPDSPLELVAHLLGAAHTCLPLPDLGELAEAECLVGLNSHWTYDHRRGLTASHIVCNGLAVNVTKPKFPVSGPDCGFVSSGGFVTGHCGLSSGQITVIFTEGQNTYILDLHFKTAASIVILSGHWRNNLGQTGLVIGVADATPVPDPTLQRSCTIKTQEEFLVVGAAALVTTSV